MNPETFPSDEWFEAMASDVERRPEIYERLGFANLRLAIEVTGGGGDRSFGLVLDGYDVHYVGEVTDGAFEAEAVLTGDILVWRDMVSNIVTNGGADTIHTLNAMSIAQMPLRVDASDPMGRDKFFRFAETLQCLFDSLGLRDPVTT